MGETIIMLGIIGALMNPEGEETVDNLFFRTFDEFWHEDRIPTHYRRSNMQRGRLIPEPAKPTDPNLKPYMFDNYQDMMRSRPHQRIEIGGRGEGAAFLYAGSEKPYLSKSYQDMKYREPTPKIGNVLDPSPETTVEGWAPTPIEWPKIEIPCRIRGYVGSLPTKETALNFKVTLANDATADGIEVYDHYSGGYTVSPLIQYFDAKWFSCGGSPASYDGVTYIDIEIYSLDLIKQETGGTKPYFFKNVPGTGWTAFSVVHSGLGERSLRSGQTIILPVFQCY